VFVARLELAATGPAAGAPSSPPFDAAPATGSVGLDATHGAGQPPAGSLRVAAPRVRSAPSPDPTTVVVAGLQTPELAQPRRSPLPRPSASPVHPCGVFDMTRASSASREGPAMGHCRSLTSLLGSAYFLLTRNMESPSGRLLRLAGDASHCCSKRRTNGLTSPIEDEALPLHGARQPFRYKGDGNRRR
jgi:hypothetical protein